MTTKSDKMGQERSRSAGSAASAKGQAAREAKKSLLVQVRSAVKAGHGLPSVDPVC